MATVFSGGQDGGRAVLKAPQRQSAVTRGCVYLGEVRWTELHPSNEVSSSFLGTTRQMHHFHRGIAPAQLLSLAPPSH